jgi:hypothetical protein
MNVSGALLRDKPTGNPFHPPDENMAKRFHEQIQDMSGIDDVGGDLTNQGHSPQEEYGGQYLTLQMSKKGSTENKRRRTKSTLAIT